jgi:hypothetical protein
MEQPKKIFDPVRGKTVYLRKEDRDPWKNFEFLRRVFEHQPFKKENITCAQCSNTFASRSSYYRHLKTHTQGLSMTEFAGHKDVSLVISPARILANFNRLVTRKQNIVVVDVVKHLRSGGCLTGIKWLLAWV